MPPYQPTLPEPSGADLPSPLFAARPGWGGQLKQWLRERSSSLLFRGVILAVAILIVFSLLRTPSPEQSPVAEETPIPNQSALAQVARPGDGMSNLAVRALDDWLAIQNEHLDGIQHLYAVDRLTRVVATVSGRVPPILYAGEMIQFPSALIQLVVIEAQSLNAAHYQSWAKLVQ